VRRARGVDCSSPGIARLRRGRGYTYVDADGARVKDEVTIDRIRALAIPPAWRAVWICRDSRGQRVLEGRCRRRLLGEGLPHLEASGSAAPSSA
jgi:DNA topoisomerase-1